MRASRPFAFAIVRDPVERFVSAYSDHSKSVQRPGVSSRTGRVVGFVGVDVLVAQLALHARELASGAWTVALVPPHAADAVAAAFPSYDALHRALAARGPAAVADLRRATATGARVGPQAAADLHALLTSTNPAFKCG